MVTTPSAAAGTGMPERQIRHTTMTVSALFIPFPSHLSGPMHPGLQELPPLVFVPFPCRRCRTGYSPLGGNSRDDQINNSLSLYISLSYVKHKDIHLFIIISMETHQYTVYF
jgi:hypothetical protein